MTEKSTAKSPDPSLIDFGYEEIPLHEKEDRVRAVFDSVASSYDVMNDIMSLGCLLYTSPSPRDYAASRMPSSA